MLRRLAEGEQRRKPDAYVYRVLVNSHNDSRRRRWWAERPIETLPETTDADDAPADIDVSDAVERALAGLSPPNRAVVVLRFYAHVRLVDQRLTFYDSSNTPLGTFTRTTGLIGR